MKPMVEYLIEGVLVRPQLGKEHMRIMYQVEFEDLRVVRNTGWIILNPEKYLHIPEVAAAVKDRKAQMVLPIVGSPETH